MALTDYEWEDFYASEEGTEFATQRKKNSKHGDSFIDAVAKKQHRKYIETKISEITARFPKKIHAVTIEGFQYKVLLTVLAYYLTKFIIL